MLDLERELISNLLAGDEGSRDVYADWLEQLGHGHRAALIRFQTAIPELDNSSDDKQLRKLVANTDVSWRVQVIRTRIFGCARTDCPKDWSAIEQTDDPRHRRCRPCGDVVAYCCDVEKALSRQHKHALDPELAIVRCTACDRADHGHYKFCLGCGNQLSTSAWPGDRSMMMSNPPAPQLAAPVQSRRPVVADPAVDLELEGPESRVIEGYRLTRKLELGGVGDVYEAAHVTEARRVMIRLLASSSHPAPQDIERCWRVARDATAIGHASIVEVLGCGELPDGDLYMITEPLVGTPLEQLIAAGPLTLDRVRAVFEPLYAAVAAAHARGLVHHQIRPASVWVSDDGVKLVDFGGLRDDLGGILHMVPYLAPEQLTGRGLDNRTDVYGLAATLWAAVVGRPPFSLRGGVVDAIEQVCAVPARSARRVRRELPARLDTAILRGLAKAPTDRPQHVADAWGEIAESLARRKRWWPWR